MNTKLKSFTMIELIVVMSITALLFGMAITGMIILRDGVVFEQAIAEFRTTLQSTRNMARNSVLAPEQFEELSSNSSFDTQNLAGMAMFIEEDGGYSVRYCVKTGVTLSGFDCSGIVDSVARSQIFESVSFNTNNDSCNGVLFERLSGAILAMSSVIGNANNTQVCRFHVRSNTSNQVVVVQVNTIQDTIQ